MPGFGAVQSATVHSNKTNMPKRAAATKSERRVSKRPKTTPQRFRPGSDLPTEVSFPIFFIRAFIPLSFDFPMSMNK